MMKNVLFLLAISFALTTNAQDYLISFAGTGDTNTVGTVKVENLTADISITINGNDILRLTGTTDINPVENRQSSDIKIYPNPMTENTTMEFYPPVAGDAVIAILDMTGRLLSQTQTYLDKSRQEFRLSGFTNGIYLITVRGYRYQISGKLLCTRQSSGTISIEKVRNNFQVSDEKPSKMEMKGAKGTVDMPYTNGERLKLIGISGKYSTVITDIPTKDKTITFNFTSCSDADKNNYPVVEIGTQVWMAENLKTTKYSNGDSIFTTTPATKDISGESAPKYQWAYDGNESNVAAYGRLYTGYAVTDSRNVCPTGWHVPTDIEWETLKSSLGDESNAGEKLKETGTTHWQSPNIGATNETGFTAIPGGGRTYSFFYSLHVSSHYLSSTQNPYNLDWIWGQSMYYDSSAMLRGGLWKSFGHPVRCLKGQGIFVPSVTTDTVSNITTTTATCGGNVTDEGGSTVTSRGVCWSMGTLPTIANNTTTDSAGAGSFISIMTNLDGGKTYNVRAYATNSEGTGYGIVRSFTTSGQAPSATTQLATDVNTTSATLNGVVNANYFSSTVNFEYGTTTGYGQTITAAQSPVLGNSNTNVTAEISGLAAGTIYHYRVNAVNSLGTTNGDDISFTTLGQIPLTITKEATVIDTASATLNGTVNANYLSSSITFEFGTTTSYGNIATATQSPIIGNSITDVNVDISGLTPGTNYHFRLIGVNELGTNYGDDISFTTLGQIPLTITKEATDIDTASATLNGEVNANYLSSTVNFEYGTTTGYGQTITAAQSPLLGNSNTNVTAEISGLAAGTIYHYRVNAVNSLGTTNGEDISFTTLGQIPLTITKEATVIDTASATLNGTVNANYLSSTITFEFGTTTSYGNIATATQSPITGNSVTDVNVDISGLTPGTNYHFRLIGVNELGTNYGDDISFTTLGQIPLSITKEATDIAVNSAILNGTVNANYLSTTVIFEYGTTTSYGDTIIATQNPVSGNSTIDVSANLDGLLNGTTYHFRVKATNSLGTAYSDDSIFTTPSTK